METKVQVNQPHEVIDFSCKIGQEDDDFRAQSTPKPTLETEEHKEHRRRMFSEAESRCYTTNQSDSEGNMCSRFVAHCKCTLLDIYAAVCIFWFHLVTLESFLVVIIAVGATIMYNQLKTQEGSRFSSNLSWILVSFAVVSPMIMQIRLAFQRRETALQMLAELKAIASNIYLANSIWSWGKDGRSSLPLDHAKKTKQITKNIYYDLADLLKMPTVTRGRHRFTKTGIMEASKVNPRLELLIDRLSMAVKQNHLQIEVLKYHGLPPNEASRANQYNWFLQARIEKLINVKIYRTPQATRSFTRIFIWILPLFYGPYYVYVSGGDDIDGTSTNFAFALSLSVMTSVVMIGIFNVERALEDPFTENGLDCVRVTEVFERMHRALDLADDVIK